MASGRRAFVLIIVAAGFCPLRFAGHRGVVMVIRYVLLASLFFGCTKPAPPGSVVSAAAAPADVLVLPQEARQHEGGSRAASNDVLDGPVTIIRVPQLGVIADGPVALDIQFDAGTSGHPPDMATLQIRYIKLIHIDVTRRLLPFLDGNRILHPGLRVPSGTHRFQVRLQDTAGNQSIQHFEIARK